MSTIWIAAGTIADLENMIGMTLAEQAEVARLAFEKRDEAHRADEAAENERAARKGGGGG